MTKLVNKTTRKIDSMLRANGIDSNRIPNLKEDIKDTSVQILISCMKENKKSLIHTIKTLKNDEEEKEI